MQLDSVGPLSDDAIKEALAKPTPEANKIGSKSADVGLDVAVAVAALIAEKNFSRPSGAQEAD